MKNRILKTLAGCLISLSLFMPQAHAGGGLKRSAKQFPKLLWRSAKNMVRPRGLMILGATAVASYGTSHFNSQIISASRSLDPGRRYTGFGRDYYGTALNMSLPQTGVFLTGLALDNRKLYGTGSSLLAAFLMERSAVGLLQMATGDGRPDPLVARNLTGGTFPSGHTTSGAAFAAVIQSRHGLKAALPFHIASLYTGWSRVADGAHRPHEVVAGLGIGYAIGLASAEAQKGLEAEEMALAITPQMDFSKKEYGLAFQIQF